MIKSNLSKSRMIPQNKVYVKFDELGNTSIISDQQFQRGFSYRRVRNAQQTLRNLNGKIFQDVEFIINEHQLNELQPGSDQPIVLKRLYDIYKRAPKSINANFFPNKQYLPPRRISSDPTMPAFVNQIGNFSMNFYKSFFITQKFQQNGLYQVIVNKDGRFQIQTVDDRIPVGKYSDKPIWGLQLDQSWQIILLKVWAKINGGYSNLKTIPPFYFLQSFTNSNWKYYNLQRQGYDFLAFYTGRIQNGKFILKTKNYNQIFNSGLIPNSCGYQLIDLVQTTTGASNVPHASQIKGIFQNDFNSIHNQNNKNRKWIATIRSTLNNKWSGNMSVIDKSINNFYQPNKCPIGISRDFMVQQKDFLNLFSCAYIASNRQKSQKNYFCDYFVFQIQPNAKNSIYLKFNIPQNGWFDFSIKQTQQNKIKASTKSQIKVKQQYMSRQQQYTGLRYLKLRFCLVKQNDSQSPSIYADPNYQSLKYDTYQIDNYQGYNRGDARFLKVVKGNYILKIKPQKVNKKSYFVINYASNSQININQIFPDKKTTSQITRQSMTSIIQFIPSYHLNKNRKDQQIVFANMFEQIGYGFIGIRSKKTALDNILIDIDPRQVQKSGYKFKNQFKHNKQPFSILVKPGQSTSIVVKKTSITTIPAWPPIGIQIFRQPR